MMKITSSTLKEALQSSRGAFLYVGLFSFFISALMLTVPLYMLQLFDRVLASHSIDTLLFLSLIAILALLAMALLDIARARVLARIAVWVENKLSPWALVRGADVQLFGSQYSAQSLRDVRTIAQFMGGNMIIPFFDAPWVPLYVLVIFYLKISLGMIATVGAMLLFCLALYNEFCLREPQAKSNNLLMKNQAFIESSLENAETMQAMGMLPSIMRKWFESHKAVSGLQTWVFDRSGAIQSATKFLRLVLQLAMLGVGAYFVVQGELTAGGMIAGSIIAGRALVPVQQSIGAWKQFMGAKMAYQRLRLYLNAPDLRDSDTALPKAKGHIECNQLIYVPPQSQTPILAGVHFQLQPGEVLGVIGPSGAGKSTLLRLLLGLWPVTRGHMRLDGANVYTWDRADFGSQVGYLAQRPTLFTGTVKENIARMQADADDASIIDAAKRANMHEMILHLSAGYDTPIQCFSLSGGQSQGIALARALYGDPCLLVLDEPETNLDKRGEESVLAALSSAKARGMTIVMVTQRPHFLAPVDKVLVLEGGKMTAFGPADEVIPQVKTT
jgi:PrtD family type I secretion system ABC transporter